MTYQAFTGDPAARRRYWARSHLGWRLVGRAAPNRGHRAVAALQGAGLLAGVITQNVDGLHQAAGARDVTDLHGRLDRVRCLDCGRLSARGRAARPAAPRRTRAWHAIAAGDQPGRRRRPARTTSWPASAAVDCDDCGGAAQAGRGVLRRDRAAGPGQPLLQRWSESRSLLVLGSSLTVMSGHRFVLRAARDGMPGGDRQPGRHPRRPVRDGHRRRSARHRPAGGRGPGRRPELTPAYGLLGAATAPPSGRTVEILHHPGLAKAESVHFDAQWDSCD